MENGALEGIPLTSDDQGFEYRTPGEEVIFLRAVADGNMAMVQQNIDRQAFNVRLGMGVLSEDPLTNVKYHFIVTAALVARQCISAGMTVDMAFRLSDRYIRMIDVCGSISDAVQIHAQMVTDYTRRMQLLKYPAASRQVTNAISYIYEHIGSRITVELLATAVGTSPAYLSRIFIKETGMSVSGFIRRLKVEYAKNLLQYSDTDMAEIAMQLSYSSQSHFISRFREETGMTPKAYRELYRRDMKAPNG